MILQRNVSPSRLSEASHIAEFAAGNELLPSGGKHFELDELATVQPMLHLTLIDDDAHAVPLT